MSEFACEVVKIEDIVKHPNADKLKICKIKGFNCITSDLEDGTPRYKVGDYVVYIPEAAVVPDWLLKKMGFWDEVNQCGTLSGSRKNRVKIIKLRGEYSQGIMYPVSKNIPNSEGVREPTLHIGYPDMSGISQRVELGDDVAQLLDITKYEPAVPEQMRGVVGALFGYTKSYDIESLQNYPDTFQEGEQVVVTEKLHGTQVSFGFLRNPPEGKDDALIAVDGKKCAYVSSKGLSKQGFVQQYTEQNKSNIYVRAFDKFIVPMAKSLVDDLLIDDATKIIIYGEIFGPGVQSGFTYGQKEATFRVFDVYFEFENVKNNGYLSDDFLDVFCISMKLERVPVLYRGPYSKDKMIELRDGQSSLGGNIKEGVVIRPVVEGEEVRGLSENRKQVKFVSPAYKMKETGEEIN